MAAPNDPPVVAAPSAALDFEELARMFAAQSRELADTTIETLAAEAVRQWRLDEATFWQRVKFHARLLRARGRIDSATGDFEQC